MVERRRVRERRILVEVAVFREILEALSVGIPATGLTVHETKMRSRAEPILSSPLGYGALLRSGTYVARSHRRRARIARIGAQIQDRFA